ncbi:DUF3631 domain-containing protein [Streptomyces longwoodensis]
MVAGLGSLPDTISTRSIVVRMRRRARNERVEPFRARTHEAEGHKLRDRLAEWAAQARGFVPAPGPRCPTESLTVPPTCGSRYWPSRTPSVASGPSGPATRVTLVRTAQTTDKHSLGIRLLTDLRNHVLIGKDKLPTIAALDRLNAPGDAPWADLDGKPLDNRRLARMLREYMTADNPPVRSRNIRTAGGVLKNFYAEDLADAWARYCPPPPRTPLQALHHYSPARSP